jgi:vancomycin resistance protein VanJ
MTTETPKTPADRICAWLATTLARRKESGSPLQRLVRWLQLALRASTFAYLAFLLLLTTLLEWHAERHWLTAFLLYVPQQAWLLPLAFLVPFALLLDPRLCLWQLGGAVFLLVIFMDYEWSWPAAAKGRIITLVTNNIGEAKKYSAIPFIQAEQADIIVLQEASYRGSEYAVRLTNYFAAEQGQFVILSRWPVKNSGNVPVRAEGDAPLAAWFELDCEGRTLVVYGVHLLTPRAQLESLRGIGFLAALAGREGRHGSKLRTFNQNFWDNQMDLARKLAAEIEKEQRPFLIAGDFNAPNHGVVYHLFASKFNDAFESAGRGYGFTFPGASRNPLTLFGPWLRLDHVFASQALRPVYCRAESNRASQHRAVAARFEWKESK